VPGEDDPVRYPQALRQRLEGRALRAVPDEGIALSVDVGPVWERKLAAIRCHRSQAGESPILAAPPERQRLFLAREHFTLGALRPEGTERSPFTELEESDAQRH